VHQHREPAVRGWTAGGAGREATGEVGRQHGGDPPNQHPAVAAGAGDLGHEAE